MNLFNSSIKQNIIFLTVVFFAFVSAATITNAATFTVTRPDDRDATCVSSVDCSLREAVKAANSLPTDDEINFAALSKITLTNEIVITNNGALIIRGSGADVLTIDGGAGTNRIFYTNNATVTISGMTLTGGNGGGAQGSGTGGAIRTVYGSLTLDSINVKNNSAAQGGGVFYADPGVHYIINSTFSGNTASFGGGFEIVFGRLTVVNSTISGNSSGYSGGFFNDGANTTLRNVTVTNNIANIGGGFAVEGGMLNLGNTIVSGNTATNGMSPEILFDNSANAMIVSAGGNLIGDSAGDSANTGSPITYQSSDILDKPPVLGALQNNGGTTPTHALLFGSPAIDKGINSLAVDPFDNSPLLTDQRGFARIFNGTVDIGAFEVDTLTPPTPTITPTPTATPTATPTLTPTPLPTPIPNPTTFNTFTNSAPITINDAAIATPYPSNVTVSGMIGGITDIKVRLNNLSHTYLSDVAILLVAPNTNKRFILLSDCGDALAPSNVTVTFEDQASSLVPCDATRLPAGSYRPTSRVFIQNDGTRDPTDPFPAPAPQPATSYGEPAPTGTATLNGTFSGINPNGVWSLYVVDYFQGDSGSIAGGYSLVITTVAPTAATVSVGGRVSDANGAAIAGVRVTLTDSQGIARSTTTSSNGQYAFEAQSGETYVLSVADNRYRFAQPSLVLNVNDEANTVNFTALQTTPRTKKRVRFF